MFGASSAAVDLCDKNLTGIEKTEWFQWIARTCVVPVGRQEKILGRNVRTDEVKKPRDLHAYELQHLVFS